MAARRFMVSKRRIRLGGPWAGRLVGVESMNYRKLTGFPAPLYSVAVHKYVNCCGAATTVRGVIQADEIGHLIFGLGQ
ncbi:hypothetical protein C1O66_13895 [Paucibacter aquatile]|uniref:Uncharacterized protein n=1 Tax=Kinneretia aquatilis TaxID=2070761 RepID=A0A2N8KYG4_9BURK|nr:hypothetical protein C1O66_13895 [Paucibacter aquatile]